MSEWLPIETAPKDGTRIEIKQEDAFPLLAYYGGGADKAFREWNSCRQIYEKNFWRPYKGD